MKSFSKILAAVATSMLVAGTAVAADVNPVVMPTVAPTAPAAPTFNWNRFYVGTYGGAWWEMGPVSFDNLRAGGVAGYNMQFDRFVVGLQGSVGVYDFASPTLEAAASARAGILAGDSLLLYGIVGIGYDGCCGGVMTLGGGAEFAVSQNVTIRVEGVVWKELGTPFDYFSVTAGLNWYVGN